VIKNEGQPPDAAPEEQLIEADPPEAASAPEEGDESPPEGAEMLLELVLAEHAARAAEEEAAALPDRIDGVLIGQLAAFGDAGQPIVTFPGAPPEGFSARAMAALGPPDIGRDVALMFEGADPKKPVVMGRMFAPSAPAVRPEARADGERLEFTAEKEIVFRCGKASITLTRAGKILIRGAYLLARSSGVNRIQGGSVQIN
jgi:hypothetical protein